MPNRIIKESICTSDNLNELKAEEENFFYRLLVNCDDYGIADARVPILRSKCYPLKTDTIKDKDIENWLDKLVKANLVFIYEIDGKRYIKMRSWEKHQQIRAKRSKFPLPSSESTNVIADDIKCNQVNEDDSICHRNPIQSNPIQSESEYESNPQKASDELLSNYTTNSKLQNTITDFINMRKSIKKPMTDRAIELLLINLNKLSTSDEEKIAILEQSIMNSWQSVFPLKTDNKQQAKPTQPSKNGFNNFTGRTYDANALEKRLLEKSKGELI